MGRSLNSNPQSDLSAWFGSVHAACTDGSGEQTDEICKANCSETFDHIHFWTTPIANCAAGEDACAPYARWVTDFMAGVGGN